MNELMENIQKMMDENVLRFFSTQYFSFSQYHLGKILILIGSHGSEDGISGLTDKDPRNVDEGYGFYREDCDLLGIEPGPH